MHIVTIWAYNQILPVNKTPYKGNAFGKKETHGKSFCKAQLPAQSKKFFRDLGNGSGGHAHVCMTRGMGLASTLLFNFRFRQLLFEPQTSLPRYGLNARRVGLDPLPAGRPGSQRLPCGPAKAPAP